MGSPSAYPYTPGAKLQLWTASSNSKAAIRNLPPGEFQRIRQWFLELDQTRWDQQLDRDSAAGKLDFLFEEAEAS